MTLYFGDFKLFLIFIFLFVYFFLIFFPPRCLTRLCSTLYGSVADPSISAFFCNGTAYGSVADPSIYSCCCDGPEYSSVDACDGLIPK